MHHKFSSFKNINTIHLIGAQCCHTVSVKQQLTLLTTFSMEAFRQAVTFGVSTAKSGPGQELLTLALTRSFPPKSRTDRVQRDSAEMEQEIVVLRKVKSECLSAVTVEWAAGSCLALNLCGGGCGQLFSSKEAPLWSQRY